MVCQGLSIIEPAEMRVLILGSMPGRVSLKQRAYYAHPRNAFWSIMSTLCHQAWSSDYEKRYQVLKSCKIGLWDVLSDCERKGSLDAAIQKDGLKVNDFISLLDCHPECSVVAFNGAKAGQLFKKHVAKPCPSYFTDRILIDLPSTSPAHAQLNLAEKTKIWQDKLGYFL